MKLTLISHALCPYVQRAAIVLAEKGVPFGRRDIDLNDKPDWFLALSPLGKTPVLLAGDAPIFESAVICEYLDETTLPRLHPQDALERARHRAWIEYASAMLAGLWAYYNAPDTAGLAARRAETAAQLDRLEQAVDAHGPWFAGARFGIVDAAFAPVLRYFDTFDAMGEPDAFAAAPRLRAWRKALAGRPSVQQAVARDYPEKLRRFIAQRGGELGRRAEAVPA
ncbi:MAG: glutathione S-transferase family protein [Comamonadaceae bacterium]|nr:MAG: glutathione S-transferase family protein [Comamonadaceae bacterium]